MEISTPCHAIFSPWLASAASRRAPFQPVFVIQSANKSKHSRANRADLSLTQTRGFSRFLVSRATSQMSLKKFVKREIKCGLHEYSVLSPLKEKITFIATNSGLNP